MSPWVRHPQSRASKLDVYLGPAIRVTFLGLSAEPRLLRTRTTPTSKLNSLSGFFSSHVCCPDPKPMTTGTRPIGTQQSHVGIYPKEVKPGSEETSAALFTASSCTRARMWKGPECPSADARRERMVCMHAVGVSLGL